MAASAPPKTTFPENVPAAAFKVPVNVGEARLAFNARDASNSVSV